MRTSIVCLFLALAAKSLLGQEDEGVELNEDPPQPPKTIEKAVQLGLRRLRPYTAHGPDAPRGVALKAFVLYTRAVCGDLGKEDRATLTAWSEAWKRDERHAGFGNPLDLAATILALTAANADPKAKSMTTTEYARRPPRGSRFDKDHWMLMHECAVRLTTEGVLRQGKDGGWGIGESNLVTTHFVLVALREAARAGYPVGSAAFAGALGFLQKAGIKGAYRNTSSAEPGPTEQAMGMVCVWICRERLALLADPERPVPDWSRELAERTALLDPLFRDPGKPPDVECLWALEQLGSLTGQAELGGRVWYREGTNRILAAKWLEKKCEEPEHAFSLCYALLFLKRPTAPLAAGK